MDIVTAITGASGALYAQRFIQGLVQAGVHVHLVVSPLGRRLLHDELGMETVDPAALAGTADHTVTLYNYNDVGSKLASGSFLHDGMVVVPCSSNTLAEVAHGLGDRSEEHTSELQSRQYLVCRLLLEKKTCAPPDTRQLPSHPRAPVSHFDRALSRRHADH